MLPFFLVDSGCFVILSLKMVSNTIANTVGVKKFTPSLVIKRNRGSNISNLVWFFRGWRRYGRLCHVEEGRRRWLN